MNSISPIPSSLPGQSSPLRSPSPALPGVPGDTVQPGASPPPQVDMRKAAAAIFAASGGEGRVEQVWQQSETSLGSARWADGSLYLARNYEPKTLDSLDPGDGHTRWSKSPGGGATTPPVVVGDGTLFVGGLDRRLHCVDQASGDTLYSIDAGVTTFDLGERYPTRFEGRFPFLGADARVHVLAGDRLISIDPKTRAIACETPIPPENELETPIVLEDESARGNWGTVYAPLAVGKDGTVYGGARGGNLVALEPKTGTRKWACPSGEGLSLSRAPLVGQDGTLYAVASGRDRTCVIAVDADTGTEKWRFPQGGSSVSTMTPPVEGPDGTLYLGADGRVLALDPSSGQEKWACKLPCLTGVAPTVANDVVYVAAGRQLFGIETMTGQQTFKVDTPNFVRSAVVADHRGGLYFGGPGTSFGPDGNTLVAMVDPPAKRRAAVEEAVRAPDPDPVPPESHSIDQGEGFILVDGVRLPVRQAAAPGR